jgi:hypothetical protein
VSRRNIETLITIKPRLYPGSDKLAAQEESGFPINLLISEPKRAIKKIPAKRRPKNTGFELFIIWIEIDYTTQNPCYQIE